MLTPRKVSSQNIRANLNVHFKEMVSVRRIQRLILSPPLNPGSSHCLPPVLSPIPAPEWALLVCANFVGSQPPPLLCTSRLQSLTRKWYLRKGLPAFSRRLCRYCTGSNHTYRQSGFVSPTCLDSSGESKALEQTTHRYLPVSPLSHVTISKSTNKNLCFLKGLTFYQTMDLSIVSFRFDDTTWRREFSCPL